MNPVTTPRLTLPDILKEYKGHNFLGYIHTIQVLVCTVWELHSLHCYYHDCYIHLPPFSSLLGTPIKFWTLSNMYFVAFCRFKISLLNTFPVLYNHLKTPFLCWYWRIVYFSNFKENLNWKLELSVEEDFLKNTTIFNTSGYFFIIYNSSNLVWVVWKRH